MKLETLRRKRRRNFAGGPDRENIRELPGKRGIGAGSPRAAGPPLGGVMRRATSHRRRCAWRRSRGLAFLPDPGARPPRSSLAPRGEGGGPEAPGERRVLGRTSPPAILRRPAPLELLHSEVPEFH